MLGALVLRLFDLLVKHYLHETIPGECFEAHDPILTPILSFTFKY